MIDEESYPKQSMASYSWPKTVGWWKVNETGLRISVMNKKPNVFVRFFNKILIGWIYVDETD